VHGIVLTKLRDHVVHLHGKDTWSALLLAAGLHGRVYVAVGDYPDEEVAALVQAAAKATRTSPGEVLEGFGRALAPDLIATYAFLVPPGWGALDLLQSTEQTIHQVVRARDKDAHPPVLGVTRVSPDAVTIRYSSARRLCALARGVALGVGDYYGTPLTVTESVCLLRGGAECRLEVRTAVPAPRAARSAHLPTGAL
jgi:hypothetical protein